MEFDLHVMFHSSDLEIVSKNLYAQLVCLTKLTLSVWQRISYIGIVLVCFVLVCVKVLVI